MLLNEGGLTAGESRALGKVALANYFAAALIMPYEPFLESANALRFDIELLQHHFGTSFEQVCHRLTTLQRQGGKGVPFHMLRVDIAGNVSKRFSLSGLRIPGYGGACPRWNVYADGIDLDNPDRQVPAGVQCRTCERMDCRQRAFPPVYHRLNIDENV